MPKDDLLRLINPAARDRWQSQTVRSYTPERIEQVLRSSMSGDLLAQWELFDLMEATWPRLVKNLQDLKGAIKQLEWTVMPWSQKGEAPTPDAQARADALEEVIWNMEPAAAWDEADFEGTLDNVLDAWAKGISVTEILWASKETQVGTLIAPRATNWVHGRYYGYPAIGPDRLMLNAREIEQSAATSHAPRPGMSMPRDARTPEGLIDFPEHKFIVSMAKVKTGHPAGSSMLRLLAWWWSASNFSAEWFLNYAQIFGMPFRWANYDPNASQTTINVINEMLECMGSSCWAAFPAGTTMELKEAARGASDNPQKAFIDVADKVCDILIVRQTLTTDAGDRGTQALGTVHSSVRADVIDEAGGWAARTLTRQLVRPFCILNYGDTNECPYLMPARKQVKDTLSMAQRDQMILQSGVVLPRDWYYDRHDIPIPGPEDEVISAPQSNPFPPGFGPLNFKAGHHHAVHAKDATSQLVDNVLEDLTGVQAAWLGNVRPHFERLIAAALDRNVSDADLVRTIESAQRQLPELFDQVNHTALEDSLRKTMTAAMVNGAVRGFQKRGRTN